MPDDSPKSKIFLAAITIAALAPFLNKAFHIDDSLFLWIAQQIAKYPADPYGFDVNWVSAARPMWIVMKNPPLCSYFIAGVAALAGWSEIALHTAFLFWAVISILGTFAIARRFCDAPIQAALLTLFTPVFFVSATNVMCDVMLLALFLWAIEFWLRGLDRDNWQLLFIAALLISAALLTKYFGLALVPLLGAYTIIRARQRWPALFFLLIPIAVTIAFEIWTTSIYEHGLFTIATSYAHTLSASYSWLAQLLTGLSFAGGCLFSFVFLARDLSRKVLALAAAAISILIAAFYFFVPRGQDVASNAAAVWIEGGIFSAIGAGILFVAILNLLRRRDADSWLLGLWFFGTFAFAAFFNWSITARTLLPFVPCAAILLLRRFPPARATTLSARNWPILAAALVSILVAASDYMHADAGRAASAFFEKKFRGDPGRIWFEGHWGFQFYMQQWNATPFDRFNSEIKSGDIMIIPSNSSGVVPIQPERVFKSEELELPRLPFLTTMSRATGAGFYSSILGPLPWAVDSVPPEIFYYARFR